MKQNTTIMVYTGKTDQWNLPLPPGEYTIQIRGKEMYYKKAKQKKWNILPKAELKLKYWQFT